MRRIMVIGCSGSGKSTFARRLGERLGLPVVHIDALFWEPGWVEAEEGEFRRRVAAATAADAWVMDGNYASKTFDLRLPRADAIVRLEQPRWLCLTRVIWRWLASSGRARPDMVPGCPEKIDWAFLKFIWDYPKRAPGYLARIEREAPAVPLYRLRGDRAIRAFLADPPGGLTLPRRAARRI